MASGMSPTLAQAIVASAGRLGVNPVDLGTSLSYETGGRFSPSLWGGAGGRHLGLAQFGPEEQQKYGVTDQQTAPQQMGAVESFLRDRGVRPGMGLLDIYSTINAGSPGLYGRSDAANGGLPGTVADKVASMAPHRANAENLISSFIGPLPDGTVASPGVTRSIAPAAPGVAPAVASPAVAEDTTGKTPDGEVNGNSNALQNVAKLLQGFQQKQQAADDPLPAINFPMPKGLQRDALMASIARLIPQRGA